MSHDPSAPENNPLGLGPRDRQSSNTGSVESTHYDAVASDPYHTGEPEKRFDEAGTDDENGGGRARRSRSRPADPEVPSSDEP
ncbi:MAG TPA: hypothetical protein VEZ47_08125 [Gemmatirosa sp.]|jgi:hypothetical protein|nr:hypothetical protein [Gemmatirosa sp.]